MSDIDTRELVHQLARRVRGEIRFDRLSRLLYSTDASIYQIEPIGVVLPHDAEDVIATTEIAAEHNVPVIPRGGGTSLAGQVVGHALIMDMSKTMNSILEVSAEEQWVRVQPGMTLDAMNRELAVHGLRFGPDPSSGNRATVGGTLGNNGTGAHSILYGMSVKQTIETDVVLADGTQIRFGPVGQSEEEQLARTLGLPGVIYRQVPRLLERFSEAIWADYPRTWRRAGGYNLDYARDRELNIAKLMAGAEGTLGTIVAAKLNLHPLPREKGLVVVEFSSLVAAMEAVPAVLETGPSAVELNDDHLLSMARTVPEFAKRLTFVQGEPAALLIVEYYGQHEAEVSGRMDFLIRHLKRRRLGEATTPIRDPKEMANVWQVRKDAVGLVMSRPGDHKPIAFIEDVAVPVGELPAFVEALQRLVGEHGTQAAFYGHASAGCLHVRPLINQKDPASLEVMASILQATADLIVAHGGALSGEHGAGIVRSGFNEQIFGPRLYQAFRELKGIFDPGNLMNPGKLVRAPHLLDDLRYGPAYRSRVPAETGLNFDRQQGLDGAIEMCNGQGVCRKLDQGAMCPSFQASRDEMHSTRGRANVLRAAISGQLRGGLDSQLVKDALDLCLACKSCKAECPSAVDMAKLKYEVQYQARKQGKTSLRDWMFGHAHLLNQVGAAFAPLSNWVMRSGISKWFLHHFLGIHKSRTMPAWARPTFSAWWRQRGGSRVDDGESQVVLFHETLTDYNSPEIGQAAVKVLEAAGYEVIILEDRKCCGRPLLSKGFIDKARKHAVHNIALLAPYAQRGIPIVGCEPSCVTMLQDDYLDLVPGDETESVARSTSLILDFVADLQRSGRLALDLDGRERELLVHCHCHERAVDGTEGTVGALQLLPNTQVTEIDAGCCGMAGAFGFEKEHYAFSLEVGEGRLFPAVRAADPEAQVLLTGASCRDQVEHATGRRVRHPIEILAKALEQ